MTQIRFNPLGRMTAAETAVGRFMRAPDEHPAAPVAEAVPEAPAAEEAPTPAAPEAPVEKKETTAEDLEREFDNGEEPEEAAPEAKAAEEKSSGEEQPKEEPKPDSVTDAVAEAVRRAEEAERRAEYWRGKAEGTETPAPPAAEQPQEDQRPDPSKYEFGEADPKYVEDLTKFTVRQEYAEQQHMAGLRAEVATMEAKYERNVATRVEKYPDYHDKVTKGADEGKFPVSAVMALGIKHSDFGPDVAYYLATNVAEATRIAGLGELEQAKEFGRLEYRFEQEAKPAAKTETSAPKATKAPEPPKNLARGAGGKFAAEPDTDDFAAFEKFADPIIAHKR